MFGRIDLNLHKEIDFFSKIELSFTNKKENLKLEFKITRCELIQSIGAFAGFKKLLTWTPRKKIQKSIL